MIDYGKFWFAAPPRTASTWMMKAAGEAGLGDGFKADVHHPAPPSRDGVLSVSMVRHPADWLVSYYRALQGGSVGVSCVDAFMPLVRKSADLHAFLDVYLREAPGAVGDMFDTYAADSVIRVEDLPWAATELFGIVGVGRRESALAGVLSPQNPFNGPPVVLSKRMRAKIISAESEICERYEYF